MRKSADLNLTDRILIRYFAEGRLREAIETHRDLICHETLALELSFVEQPTGDTIETFAIGEQEFIVAILVDKSG
jgi:hypothetical protein